MSIIRFALRAAAPVRTTNATAHERNSASIRSSASIGKSGTKMQAKGTQSSVFRKAVSYQLQFVGQEALL
jgi:hypothetical protein